MGKRKSSNLGSAINRGTNKGKDVVASSSTSEPLPCHLLLNSSSSSSSSSTKNNKKHQHYSSRKQTAIALETLHPQAVYVGRQFFSSSECQAWIDYVDGNDENSKMDFVSHPATRFVAHRSCHRWQQKDCWTMAQALWDRIEETGILKQLDFGFDSEGTYQPVNCNGNLRLYKYEKGMSFGRHVDGSHPTEKGRTEVTVLIYLSNCEGGATRFYTPVSRKSGRSVAFEPEVGAILLHVHGDKCLDHEADPVTNGNKYVLRTDLVYEQLRK